MDNTGFTDRFFLSFVFFYHAVNECDSVFGTHTFLIVLMSVMIGSLDALKPPFFIGARI